MQRSLQELARKEMERFHAEMACKDEQAQDADCRDLDLEAVLLLLYNNVQHPVFICILQVEPGKPGAEVSKKKNYKSKKVFAYRMCTG